MKRISGLHSRSFALLRSTVNGLSATHWTSTLSQSQTVNKTSKLELLQRVADGKITPQAAVNLFDPIAEYEAVENYAKVDTKRAARTGFPEVVYAESKTAEQVAAIMKVMIEGGKENVMASRVTSQMASDICAMMQDQHLTYYEVPRILALKLLTEDEKVKESEDKSQACVLCAGTSDLPIAEEAAVTLGKIHFNVSVTVCDGKGFKWLIELANYRVTRLYDVGVAGIHRLLRNQHILRASDVAICVAGMDGALPGVVGGLTPAPVIAVPTSVGYGASFGGLAPLLTMLNACSPGVGVVNIDNGFGAAVLAVGIENSLPDMSPSSPHGFATAKQGAMAKKIASSSSEPSIQSFHGGLRAGRRTIQRKRHYNNDNIEQWVFAHDDTRDERQEEEEDVEEEEEEKEEEVITISMSELQNWQQKVILHVEDHFTNEQLKRISEFGRVRGSIVQEAKDYVSKMEIALSNQLEKERAALRTQAEEYVAKTAAENVYLRQQVNDLTRQIERLERNVDMLEQQANVHEAENTQFHQEQYHTQQGVCKEVEKNCFLRNSVTKAQPGWGNMNERVAGNGQSGEIYDSCKEKPSQLQRTKHTRAEAGDRSCSSQLDCSTRDVAIFGQRIGQSCDGNR
ncbi:hypothetical protein PsorP6_008223 [Peronosclerospora sorghi]|uniref:Uncharacterized protein n=1 Tax=Peronosclerospora sorghi TaxID=230839 RepID=A0ACC0WCF5_9STRA|nr:hypothetical protein PsorP6_008223 [Peronosclerospora sorghi]